MNQLTIDTDKKINDFMIAAGRCFGKKIGLHTNTYFDIELDLNNKSFNDEIPFTIQYGYPQSGCILMKIGLLRKVNDFVIRETSVYTQPPEKQILIADTEDEQEVNEINIKDSFGIDTGTVEYKGIEEIKNNHNALELLTQATNELNNAEILGKCQTEQSSEDSIISFCECIYIPKDKKSQHIQL